MKQEKSLWAALKLCRVKVNLDRSLICRFMAIRFQKKSTKSPGLESWYPVP